MRLEGVIIGCLSRECRNGHIWNRELGVRETRDVTGEGKDGGQSDVINSIIGIKLYQLVLKFIGIL